MPYVYDKNGNPVYVKPEDMLAAVEQKLIQLPKNKRLHMVDTNTGERYTLGVEGLHEALKMGWRLEEENERVLRIAKEKYGDDEGTAALLGLASGLSAGLSDVLFERAGVEVSQIQAANPTISTVASIGGMVGGALGPGLAARGLATVAKGAVAKGLAASSLKAASAITKASPAYNISRLGTSTAQAAKGALLKTALGAPKAGIRGVAADALVKGGALAAGGAVEGALYGGVAPAAKAAVEILSEDSLGNLDGVAESLVSQVGVGTLLGGAAGGIFGVGGALGGKLLKGVSGKLTSAIGEKFGPEAAEANRRALLVKSWGIPESKLRKMGDKKVELWEEVLFDEKVLRDGPIIKEGLSTEQILERARQAKNMYGGTRGVIIEEVLDNLVDRAKLPGYEVNPDMSSFVAVLDEEILKLSKGFKVPATRRLLRDLKIQRREVTPGPASFKEAHKFRVRLQDTIDAEKVPNKKMSPKGRIYIKLKDELSSEIETKVDTVFNRVADLPKTAAPGVPPPVRPVEAPPPPVGWKTKTYTPAEMAKKRMEGSATRYIGSREPLPLEEVGSVVIPEYEKLVARKGFSDIRISDLQEATEIPIEQLLATLKTMSRRGQAVLSAGDWSVATQKIKDAALYLRPDRPRLLVRFKLDKIVEAKPWPVKKIEIEMGAEPPTVRPPAVRPPEEVAPRPVSLEDIELPPELDEIVEGKFNQLFLLKEHYRRSGRIYSGLADAVQASNKEMVKKAGEDIAKGTIRYGFSTMGWRLFGNPSVLSALARTGAGMGFYLGGRLLGQKMASGAVKDMGGQLTRLNKAAKFGTITERMETFQGKVDSAIDKILKPDAAALRRKALTPASVGILKVVTGEEDREKALEKYINTLASYNADPIATSDRISASLAGLEEVAPQLAEKMATLTSNTLAYLLKFAPKRVAEPSLQPLLEKPSYSRKEIAKFERIVAAVKDPASVLLKVPSGMVMAEEIQVLKDLYPTIFESARLQISMRAAETDKLFTNAQKRRLSQLFDIPLDRTATPGYLNRMQAVHAPKKEAKGKGVSGVSLKGLRKLDDDDLPKMNQTATQRIEGEL